MNRIGIAAVGAILAANIILAAPAFAATSPPAAPVASPSVIESQMSVGAIDEKQAKRVGNKVVHDGAYTVLLDGKTGQEIARVQTKTTTGVQPNNTVYGNCGSSYIYLYDDGGTLYHFNTGFVVNGPLYDFDWRANIKGTWSSGTDNLDYENTGHPTSGSWASGNVFDNAYSPSGTYYVARVTFGAAYLNDGRICYSGYPNAGLNLYR